MVEVELRADAPPRRAAELRRLAEFPIGEPLAESDVRRAVINLLSTGIPDEVEIYREAVPGGERIVVALWLNVLVEDVRIEGQRGLSRRALRRELVLVPGDPLLEDRVLRSVYRLQDRYRAEGYLSARVRARVDLDEAARTAAVTFAVASGPRATIGNLSLEGERAALTDPEILALLPLRRGAAYREKSARQAADELRQRLISRGFRLADTELAGEQLDDEAGTASLVYRVDLGPQVEVEIVGADRRKLERKGLLPFLGAEGYDEGLVLQAVELLRDDFQAKGHYHVEIARQETPGEGSLRLALTIEPGEVYEIAAVVFEGGEAVDRVTLARLMETSPRRRLSPSSGRLVDTILAADLENVRSYFALSGWTEVAVGSRIEESGQQLTVFVQIVEGAQRRIVDVRYEGVQSIDLAELTKGLQIEPGGPYHPRRVEDAVAQLRGAYEEHGFVRAQVSVAEDWNAEETLVDLTLRVVEGSKQTAGRLIASGLRNTHPSVVRRAAAMVPGEPLSPGRLLEMQRRLYQLGIFSQVRVSLAPAAEGATIRDVVADVEEGRNHRLLYGLGFDSEEGVGGLLGYSHANLGGRATRFQLDLRASQRSERYRLVLSQRRGSRFSINTRFTLFDEDEKRPSFEVASRGGQLEVSKNLGKVDLGIFLDLRRVDLLELAADVPEEIEREQQNIDIVSLIPQVLWDRRDDLLDPHRGWLTTVQLQLALPVAGGEEDFTKLFVQQSTFHDLGPLGVLAWSLRAGAIEPHGDRSVAIAERFFAGGRTSHRAFSRDFLGILGETLDADGNPLGGNGLLLANVDLRFPIVGAFGGTVFVDGGNVWDDWRDVSLSEVRLGAGVGLRFLSPIGPLRLEIGWKLDRQPGESPSEIFVSFGNAF